MGLQRHGTRTHVRWVEGRQVRRARAPPTVETIEQAGNVRQNAGHSMRWSHQCGKGRASVGRVGRARARRVLHGAGREGVQQPVN